jgi:hypothetical protein
LILTAEKNPVASAKESGTIKIVHIRWLLDSIRRGKALVEETYQFGEIKGIQNALIRELIFEDPGWRKRSKFRNAFIVASRYFAYSVLT